MLGSAEGLTCTGSPDFWQEAENPSIHIFGTNPSNPIHIYPYFWLADRIIGLMSVARFLDQHPELDAGSRKLSGDIKDHVNPATWKGNTDPTKVNLGIAWKQGATLAAAALTADGVYSQEQVNYINIAAMSNATMLEPAAGRPGVSGDVNRLQ